MISGRAYILSFPKKVVIPKDPFSKEYYNFQMQLYSLISKNRVYKAIENEQSHFQIDYNRPFPYYTKSINTIGDQLIAIGYILKMIGLKPKAKILEFGAGWGNTTVQLSLAGFEVTAVEIGTNFCDLLTYRKKQHDLNELQIINQDMVEYSNTYNSRDYDAVLFYESFHHCWDHDLLCMNFDKLIKKNGIIIFASEPILDKCEHFPYPWGVRIDGMSIWSTRKYGWLELGYEMNYFKEMLGRYGFNIEIYQSDVSPLARIILAKK